uniref:Uncharacterized protein n=1 Tax=Anguilla anguilla TaxID=7936 RepID=A0A0E9TSR4_ANGAN
MHQTLMHVSMPKEPSAWPPVPSKIN